MKPWEERAQTTMIALAIGGVIVAIIAIFSSINIYNTESVNPQNEYNKYSKQIDIVNQRWRDCSTNNLLINYHILGCRLAGLMGGNSYSGGFLVESATDQVLKAGARVLIIDVDYLVKDPVTPLIACRSARGELLTKGGGSIAEFANAVAKFKANSRTTDPIIIFLNVLRIPKGVPEGIKYMQNIADALKPIIPHLLRQDENGVYMRQGMESRLFFQKMDTYRQYILLLTNIDTSIFRNPPPSVKMDPSTDLDMLVHARVHTHAAPKNGKQPTSRPAAYYDTPDFYRNLPSDMEANYIAEITSAFSIPFEPAMDSPAAIDPIADLPLKRLVELGVQCIPVNIYAEVTADTKSLIYRKMFKNTSFVPKADALAFVDQPVVTLDKPRAEMNSGGGVLVMPSAK
jgi:hypothetical protein